MIAVKFAYKPHGLLTERNAQCRLRNNSGTIVTVERNEN